MEFKDGVSEARKLGNLIKKIEKTGSKSPRLAAEFMVRTARVLAPQYKGILRKNINAFKKGKNSYEVISHRNSRVGEWIGNKSKRYPFPVHKWIEGLITGGWHKKHYTGKGLGYFGKAAGKTRYRFFKLVRSDIQRGLRVKIK